METRELYKQKYEAQLHEWSAKIEALSAHADKLTAEAKLQAKPHLDQLHAQVEAAKVKLEDMAQATDDKLEEVKKGIDHVWNDLKASIEGAYDTLKADKKGS
jgi:predicted  nucleic acid-binding Zn-ribbon protein